MTTTRNPTQTLSELKQPKVGDIIANSYLVRLEPDMTVPEFTEHKDKLSSFCKGETVPSGTKCGAEYIYDLEGFKGYCGTFTPEIIENIRVQPKVKSIGPNIYCRLPPKKVTKLAATKAPAPTTWGLDAISQPEGGGASFSVGPGRGEGVDIYVIDSGIRANHPELGGRVTPGWNFTAAAPGNDNTDDNFGHGTLMAQIAGGETVGVARQAGLVAVKVTQDPELGDVGAVIGGITWSVQRAEELKPRPAVFLISLGVRTDNIEHDAEVDATLAFLEDAVVNANTVGYLCCVAAGHENINAEHYSPAQSPAAFTVGAVGKLANGNLTRWAESNFGDRIDLFAPGVGIQAYAYEPPNMRTESEGTSISNAYAGGVAATILSNNALNSEQLRENLLMQATPGLIDQQTIGDGSPNLFLSYIGGV